MCFRTQLGVELWAQCRLGAPQEMQLHSVRLCDSSHWPGVCCFGWCGETGVLTCSEQARGHMAL